MKEEKMDLLPYEETFVQIKRGDLIKGKVVRIESGGILVDIGGKTEGVLPLEELSHKEITDPGSVVRMGDEIDVLVIKTEDENGTIQVSKKRADLEKTWIHIREALKSGEILHGTIIEQVKGGLVVDLGVRGFIPASHMRKHYVKNLEDYIGESLPLKVLELDAHRGRVVLSYRLASEELASKTKHSFWEDVYVGQLRTGQVARLAPFGAFVDLGGVDGLIHLSELSWKRIKHPSEIVKVADQVEVTVLGFDKEKERVSLSLRRAQPDPWTQLPEEWKPGAVLEGTISKIANRYVFVEVCPGVEGLIPRQEWSREKRSANEGEKCRVKIVEIKPEARRMLFSLKIEDPSNLVEQEDYRNYLQSQEDRPLILQDLIGDQLSNTSQ